MKTSTLAFLAFITLATSPISANDKAGPKTNLSDLDCQPDQIAKYDGEEWECADDEIGGGSDSEGYVLLDSQAQVIGYPVDFKPYSALLLLDSSYGLIGASMGLDDLICLGGSPILHPCAIVFDAPNCLGSAYMSTIQGRGSALYREAVSHISGQLFVADTESGWSTVEYYSTYVSGQGCQNEVSPQQLETAFSVIATDAWLPVFTPPLRIEKVQAN
jgi:hypothetical protein